MTEPVAIPETVHQTKDHRCFWVRQARRSDAARLLRYARTLFDEPGLSLCYSPGEFSMDIEEEERFVESHQRSNCLLLIALADDEVIGSLGFQGGKLARNRHAGTFGVAVASGWRGVGVGSALIQRLLAWAQTHPEIERLGLEVFETNPEAARLYRRFGFQEEGRRRGAFRLGERRVDAILMSLLLPPKKTTTGEC